MKITTSLNHRARCNGAIVQLWKDAKNYHLPHSEILIRKDKIFSSVSHCPEWVRTYLSGVYDTLYNLNYENLEFCHKLKGILYSTHKRTDKPKTERLYQKKLGLYLSKHSEHGFYYLGTTKPF